MRDWKQDFEKFKNISDFKSLLSLIKIIYTYDEKYQLFFRGQLKSTWHLESNYMRSLRKKNKNTPPQITSVTFMNRLSFMEKRGITKNKLEILANMQHFGQKTPLIDFTSSFFHALWFAFSEVRTENVNEHAIYVLKVTNNELKYKISSLSETGMVYHCPITVNRGLSQKSYFILDNKYWDISPSIIKINISNELKDQIIEFLRFKGITASKIYPDFKGMMLEYERLSPTYWINYSELKVTELDFNGALNAIEKAEYLDPYNPDVLRLKINILLVSRGANKALDLIKAMWKKTPKLDKNVRLILCHFRSICLLARNDFQNAITSINEAIEIAPKTAKLYAFKSQIRAMKYSSTPNESKKDVKDTGLKDIEQAIELESENPKWYETKAKILSSIKDKGKHLKEALDCINKAIELNPLSPSFWTLKGQILYLRDGKSKYLKDLEYIGTLIRKDNIILKLFESARELDEKSEIIKKAKEIDTAIVNLKQHEKYDKTDKLLLKCELFRYKATILSKLSEFYYDALESINSALDWDPENPDSCAIKGSILRKIESYYYPEKTQKAN